MTKDSALTLPRLPSQRLDGKRALVTGGGRGIGVACAAALAQAGAHVTLVARTEAEIRSVAEAIEQEGGSANYVCVDITESQKLESLLNDQLPYEILVNNAGTNHPAGFLDVTFEQFDKMVSLNLRAAFFVSQIVARRLSAEKKPGSIINVSSQMGHVGGPQRTVYCATKHALEGLTKAMAIDLGPLGIRVNSIGPTFIETPLTRPYLAEPRFRDFVLGKIKLNRLGQPEDLMGAVVFLASEASALMTGSAVMIDGGWTIG